LNTALSWREKSGSSVWVTVMVVDLLRMNGIKMLCVASRNSPLEIPTSNIFSKFEEVNFPVMVLVVFVHEEGQGALIKRGAVLSENLLQFCGLDITIAVSVVHVKVPLEFVWGDVDVR
jgi:hypothetical protein